MIEENNEIKDILLDKEEYKSGKTKKILIIIAIFVLLFIIVIIGMKLLNDNKKSKVIPQPVATLLPKSNDNSKKSSDNFQQVPIENQNQIDFDKMVKNLKEKEKLNENSNVSTQTLDKDIKKDDITPNIVNVNDNFRQIPPPKPVVKTVKNPVAPTKLTPKNISKPVKSDKTNSKSKTTISKGMYVQVSSIVKIDPTSMLFKKLKADGYNYQIYAAKTKTRTIYKVLVGPYNKSELPDALRQIKSKIKSDAFVFVVK